MPYKHDPEERDRLANAPLTEAGEGESEGFEEAERELIEHASHGDDHAASRIMTDADPRSEEGPPLDTGGEADVERSDERDA